ncbi:MAG: DUF5312 domain-containing protein [Treponema sp.]|jgi:hypothetical protein|nr:DUF5312 domain-containing protein [Treponema sp.]
MAEDLTNKVNKVFSFFSGDNEPSSDKRILLKQILKDITQNKYRNFYKFRSEEIDPSLAMFFYDLYKLIYPAQIFLQDMIKISRLKQFTLETFMNRTSADLSKRITPDALEERVKNTPPKEIVQALKGDITGLSAMFDSHQIKIIDQCYDLLMAFIQFVNFNFFPLLQKFDSKLVEGNFNFEPQFETIKAEFIIQDIENFLAVAHPIDPTGDWKTVLGILKLSRNGHDLVAQDQWLKMVTNLRDIKQSNILLQINQISLKNPIWEYKPKIPNERFVENWLEAKQTQIKSVINKIVDTQRSIQINTLVNAIFGTTEISRLQCYNIKTSDIYLKKGLEGFIYAEGLNLLSAFMADFLHKEIHELSDILLIRGQWTSANASLQMSEAIHQLLDLSVKINELDESLAEDGDKGPRLKAAMLRVDREKTQARYINSILEGVNGEALSLITSASQAFIVIGKYLKNLIEDYPKKPPEVIFNWKELGYFSKTPIFQRMTDYYKKINYLIQLMLIFTRSQAV